MPASKSVGREIPHFQRDPGLAAGIADEFGGGGANAEELIMSWELRTTPELDAANMLPADKKQPDFDYDEVKTAAELPDEAEILGVTKHGNYATLVYAIGDRTAKDALYIEADGSLSLPESSKNSPQRAALAAAHAARSTVKSAREEADEILRKAREEAERIVNEAAQSAAEDERGAAKDAAKSASEEGADARKEAASRGKSSAKLPDRTPGDDAKDATNKP